MQDDAALARAAVDLGLLEPQDALAMLGRGEFLKRCRAELRLTEEEVAAWQAHAEALARTDSQDTDGGPRSPAVVGRYGPGQNVLGEGAMGRVEACLDTTLQRVVARKRLRPGANRDRFLTEARVTGRLEHPGIVPVYELGEDPDGTPWYTMRRIRGQTLREALDEAEDRLALLPHVQEVARILAYAHNQGVVHRDVKPNNIMIGPLGETLLVDWGVAADGDTPPERVGTPAYMSPELDASRSVDGRSDVFSLGVVLREVLTGDRSRPAQDPPDLAALCRRCTAHQPPERPTAEELLQELTAWRDGRRIRSYRYGPAERVVLFARRQPLLFAACIVLALVTVSGAAALWQASSEARAQADEARQALATALVERATRANDGADHLGAAVFAAGALELGPEDKVEAWSILWAALENQSAVFDRSFPVPPPEKGLGGGRAVALTDEGQLAVLGADGRLWFDGQEHAVPPGGQTRGDLAVHNGQIVWTSGGDAGVLGGDVVAPDPTTALAARDGHLALAGREGGRPVVVIDGAAFYPDGEHIEDLAWTPDGGLVLVQRGSTVQRPGLWTTPVPSGASAVAVEAEDVLVVSRSLPTLWRLDLATGAIRDTVALEHAAIDVVAHGDQVFLGGEDGTTTVLDRLTLERRERLSGVPGGALRIAVGGGHLAAGGTGDAVRVWRLVQPEKRDADLQQVKAISPSGGLFAALADRTVGLDPETLERTGWEGPGAVAVSSFAKRIALADRQGTLRVDGAVLREAPGRRLFARWTAAWSADGEWFAVPGFDHDVAIWDGAGWSSLGPHRERVVGVAVSQDGRIAAHGYGGLLRLWTRDGESTDLEGHHGLVVSAAFAPDGLLATGEGDGSVHLWTDPPQVLRHHTGWVNALAWSEDGRTLVSGSDDGTSAIWDRDGTLLRVVRALGDVDGARFDGDALILLEGGRVVRYAAARTEGGPTLAEAEAQAGLRLDGVGLVPTQ